jgi:nucleotide-binding universal stress UspA family protein
MVGPLVVGVDGSPESIDALTAAVDLAAASGRGAAGIIVGGHRHGVVGGLVTGPVAQKLVRQSPVSVSVVRDGHLTTFRQRRPTAAPWSDEAELPSRPSSPR